MRYQTPESLMTAIVIGAIGTICASFYILDQTPREPREITMEWHHD